MAVAYLAEQSWKRDEMLQPMVIIRNPGRPTKEPPLAQMVMTMMLTNMTTKLYSRAISLACE